MPFDDLVAKCRDERSRGYIVEAIVCFDAGAYRSAIVSTWLAVAFDIFDKIFELSLAGDPEAEKFVASFEKAIANNNLQFQQNWESNLLTDARDKYQFITAQEYVDLKRLNDDRHLCAHPSRMNLAEIFEASPELAQLHIRSAVDHLLQHEASQGPAALEGILEVIQSPHFASKNQLALVRLKGTALVRARPSLVKSLIIVLLKSSLRGPIDSPQELRNGGALRCIKVLYSALWHSVVEKQFPVLFRNLTDAQMLNFGLKFLRHDPGFVDALPADQILRIERTLMTLPEEHFGLTKYMLSVPQFEELAKGLIDQKNSG